MKGAWGIYMKSDIDKAVEAEREACAKVAEEITDYAPATDREIGYQVAMAEIAAAIRKRGCGEKETLKDTNDERNDNAK